jgi:hypothetical protein
MVVTRQETALTTILPAEMAVAAAVPAATDPAVFVSPSVFCVPVVASPR